MARSRSSITGRFVRWATARRHPRETVIEDLNSSERLRFDALLAASDAVLDSAAGELRPDEPGATRLVDLGALLRLRMVADASRRDR